LDNSWFNNSLATVFKESGLSVNPGIPRHISIARTHVIIFWHTGFIWVRYCHWGSDLCEVRAEAEKTLFITDSVFFMM
jgi:hypothetical protein